MFFLNCQRLKLSVDFEAGEITSLVLDGKERMTHRQPLFALRLRDRAGETILLSAHNACQCRILDDGAEYFDFDGGEETRTLTVRVLLEQCGDTAEWRILVHVGTDALAVEWVDFPQITLPHLIGSAQGCDGGRLLYPYNEGVLVDGVISKKRLEPEYPSMGAYSMFPNMISSQMLAYLWEDVGLYLGIHDPGRAPKGIDYIQNEHGTTLQLRLFCGAEFGEDYQTDFPIVMAATDGNWESAAERYRAWNEKHLPPRVKRVKENPDLPEWYADSPLIVSYPVRGWFDTDVMAPNALYPYTNALPLIREISEATGSRIMVLLMHWEGTAPWAPPYVWPPFGGEEKLNEFLHILHQNGHLLGVYCSGFGYTLQSKLIADYNKETEALTLLDGMCAGPDGNVAISKICTAQRKGYDICPASKVGRAVLDEAYAPLFASGLDYVQILDQNHGGGQYFCYARNHGHPPMPGAWMTERMQEMLSDWNNKAPRMLFGCESAAAEPFIGNLQFSDNRFELNYKLGRPVPLYSYLYHEYLRNFMGNQVACPIDAREESLSYRMAYSFAAGDCMTLVLMPNGEVMSSWGMREFDCPQNKERLLTLIANLTRFYREQAREYLWAGRMRAAEPVLCDTVTFTIKKDGRKINLPAIISTAWECEDGSRVQILVNPNDTDMTCEVAGEHVCVPALDAVMVSLN